VIGFLLLFNVDGDLLLVSMILEAAMWLWAAGVLLVSPAEHYCTIPLFWSLMLNSNLLRVCEVSVYGLSDPFGVLIASKIALNLVLVLTTWRVYVGLVIAPIVICVVAVQSIVRCLQSLRRWLCKPTSTNFPRDPEVRDVASQNGGHENLQAPLLQNEDVPADETVVEVVVYELWPSHMPCYLGRFLGAYHTGVSADIGHTSGPLEYTFEVPDGVKPRRRGRRPMYVQGDERLFIKVGQCKKADFKKAIGTLRASPRFAVGENYKILSNNCHTFCDDLLGLLGPQVTGRVPRYARFLDDLFSFFVPGGTLQSLEVFLEVLGDDDNVCDRRCFVWTALGCALCLLSCSVPAIVAYHIPY